MAEKGHLTFWLQCLRNPQELGAIAPSSPALGAVMTREITAADAPVIELGPGTGIITKSILARGVAQKDLVLVESNQEFATMLERDFPQARVLCMDAAKLGDMDLFMDRRAGAAVSAIPFLLLGPQKAKAILSSVFKWMRPGASIYQCTYGFGAPIPAQVLRELGLSVTRIGGTVRNLPPAAVYRITKREAAVNTRHVSKTSAA